MQVCDLTYFRSLYLLHIPVYFQSIFKHLITRQCTDEPADMVKIMLCYPSGRVQAIGSSSLN